MVADKVRCSRCDSTDTEFICRTRNDLITSGERDGKPYNKIRWNRRKCRSCNSIFIHRQHLND